MRPASANHNSLGKLYHEQRVSLKMRILEDLRANGIKDGKIGFWFRNVTDENLPNIPGNMRDIFVKHMPDSAKLLINTHLTELN